MLGTKSTCAINTTEGKQRLLFFYFILSVSLCPFIFNLQGRLLYKPLLTGLFKQGHIFSQGGYWHLKLNDNIIMNSCTLSSIDAIRLFCSMLPNYLALTSVKFGMMIFCCLSCLIGKSTFLECNKSLICNFITTRSDII